MPEKGRFQGTRCWLDGQHHIPTFRLPAGSKLKIEEEKGCQKPVLTSFLASALILSSSGCSASKPPALEEAGTPPMVSMAAEIPEEEPAGQYSIKLKSDTPLSSKCPIELKIALFGCKDTINLPETTRIKEKESNLIIISKDGNEFQRLAPEELSPGNLKCLATFPHDGQYQACLQFTRDDGKNFSAVTPLQVGKGITGIPIRKPEPDKPKVVDGYEFSLKDCPSTAGPDISMPTFYITRDIRPVSNIEPMNNKPGYAVVVSEGGERFYRTVAIGQPSANKLFQQPVMFHVIVPRTGNYKLWAQFKIGGVVHSVGFRFKV